MKEYFGGNLSGKKIAVWGLAFKPHTDDIREAPALTNIDALLAEGAAVAAHDPEAMANVKNLYKDKISLVEKPYDALNQADALLIATEWPEYRTPDFDEMTKRMKSRVIFDGRNVYDLDQINELGFTYYSVGRKSLIFNA
jgi:UDPglucose 6-dehydrogenase